MERVYVFGIRSIFLKVVPDSQTSFIGILLLLLYCCIAKSKFLFLRQTISIGLVLISALSGLIFWGMVLLYQQGNAFITAIDKFLSSRIYWSGIMINRFGITAMGQKLPEDLDGWLDSTYIYMPIVFGYIPFILYALSYILMCIYLYKKGCLKELAMWAVFAVMGIMETYAFRVYYNVFLILIGCLIYRKSIKACEKLERVDDRI